jgi:hypothetical protein
VNNATNPAANTTDRYRSDWSRMGEDTGWVTPGAAKGDPTPAPVTGWAAAKDLAAGYNLRIWNSGPRRFHNTPRTNAKV